MEETRRYDQFARRLRRLEPHAFPVPAEIQGKLEAMNCLVPQTKGDETSNLIRGHFAHPKQIDWAALCSDGVRSRLVVVWGGPIKCGGDFPFQADVDYVRDSNQELYYDRSIQRVRGKEMLDALLHSAEFESGEVTPPTFAVNHDSIADGGTFQYCDRGKWHSWALVE